MILVKLIVISAILSNTWTIKVNIIIIKEATILLIIKSKLIKLSSLHKVFMLVNFFKYLIIF